MSYIYVEGGNYLGHEVKSEPVEYIKLSFVVLRDCRRCKCLTRGTHRKRENQIYKRQNEKYTILDVSRGEHAVKTDGICTVRRVGYINSRYNFSNARWQSELQSSNPFSSIFPHSLRSTADGVNAMRKQPTDWIVELDAVSATWKWKFFLSQCCLVVWTLFFLSLFIADSGRCKWIYFRKEWSSDRAGFCVVYKRKRQRPLKEDQMAQIFPWPTRRRSLSRTTKKVKWNIEIPFWRRIALVHPTVPDMLLSKAIAVAFFKEENLVSLRLWKNCRVLTAAVRRLPYIIYHPPCHWSCRCVNQDNVVITLDDQLVTRFVLQGRLFSFTSVPVRISLSKKKKTKTV